MIVVTGDRELLRRVREAGGRTCAPGEFFARFGMGGPAEPDGAAGNVDVDAWMRYFQDERNRSRE
jgi:hypothetical protein